MAQATRVRRITDNPLGPGLLANLRQDRHDQRRDRQSKDIEDIFQELRIRRRQVSDYRRGTNPETKL